MKLYAITKSGEANAALKAVQILRGSRIIATTDTAKLAANTPGPALQAGDVIKLGQLVGR